MIALSLQLVKVVFNVKVFSTPKFGALGSEGCTFTKEKILELLPI